MQKAFKILLLVVISTLLLLSFSCKKYSHNYFKGTITDRSSGDPIEGIAVILQYWDYPRGSGVPYLYDSVYTDSQGRFSFYRRKKIGWAYRLLVNNTATHSGYYQDITKDKPGYNITLRQYSYIKIKVQKTTNNPSVIVVKDDAFYFDSSDHQNLVSAPYDTTFKPLTVLSNSNNSLTWTIYTYTNGYSAPPTSVDSYQHSFNLSNQTVTFPIQYN